MSADTKTVDVLAAVDSLYEEYEYAAEYMGEGCIGIDPVITQRKNEARDAIASLPEYALGDENIVRSQDGDIVGHYPIRDELLHHINAAISRATGEGQT